MNSISTYMPFLIGDGKSQTGLFQYFDSWIKPGDAFDTLENAYVFRGSIWKRQGMGKYPSTNGQGSLVYADAEDVCDIAGGGLTSRSDANGSVLSNLPAIAGSVTFAISTSAGIETFTDDGAGNLTGTLGDTGTVTYATGAWTITLGGGRTFTNPSPIYATYSYAVKYVTAGGPFHNPIMGIKQFTNETTNTQVLVVCDTKRVSYHDGTKFNALNSFSETLGKEDGASNPQAFTAAWTNIAPYSVSISDGASTITDDGVGGFSSAGNLNPISNSTINYATGAISLGFTAPGTATITISGTLTGDYFTGNNSNFFNATNWKPTDSATGYLYLTNNVDRITLFDGTKLTRPPFCVTQANYATFTNEIAKTLDIKVYKNSLCFFRPTLVGSAAPEAQMMRSSIPNTSPNFSIIDFVSNVAGHGAATPAPTGDWIMSAQFLRDAIVVFFLNSTWLLRFTGSTADPFRFDKLNDTKTTQAPYGSIGYDLECTSMGNRGLIMCDGVNVERYDKNIIDQYLDIESAHFTKCFGFRFDVLLQSWMLYPSVGDAKGGNLQQTSSRAMIYNFMEQTWSIYRPQLGVTEADATVNNTLSCLGQGFSTTDATWASFAAGGGLPQSGKTWAEWDEAWNSYLDIAAQPALLGGDQNGWVLQLNVTNQDDGNDFSANIITKRLSPFLPGQKSAFGYLDVYYQVSPEVVLTFDFYLNNSQNSAATYKMTLNGTGSNNFYWKRIYLSGMVGEFIQIQITDNSASWFKILGMILHAAPAGRLTPGSFL